MKKYEPEKIGLENTAQEYVTPRFRIHMRS